MAKANTTPKPEPKKKTEKVAKDTKKGPGQKAAAGLTRSRAFLAREQDRIAGWADENATGASEDIKEAIAALDDAIAKCGKIPNDFKVRASCPYKKGDELILKTQHKTKLRATLAHAKDPDKAIFVVQEAVETSVVVKLKGTQRQTEAYYGYFKRNAA